MKREKDYLAILTMIFLAIAAIGGIASMNFNNTAQVINQYGQNVTLYGYGIYSHDTLLQGATSVGTDLCILLVFIPMFVYTYIKYQKNSDAKNTLKLITMYGVSFYYAASISLGLTYNQLFLVYVALFSCSLFGFIRQLTKLQWTESAAISKGMIVFLSISGAALLVAWLPDVINSLINSQPLADIGIYSTIVTYVLDMGIISPLCFVTIYLMTKKKSLGTVLFAILCKLCLIVGIMMIFQTVCQVMAKIDLPIPVIVTKSGSFFLLGFFAWYFQKKI